MKSGLLGVVCVIGLIFTGNVTAALEHIDFDDRPTGTPVTTQYQQQGVTLSLIESPLAGPYTYALQTIDGVPLNIFGASGNAINPGDDTVPPYWAIEFNFSTPIDYFSIVALDAEEAFTITAYQDQTPVSAPQSSTLLGTRPDSPFRGSALKFVLGQLGGAVTFNRVVVSPNPDIPEVFDNLEFNSVVPVRIVAIDIKPGGDVNPINPGSQGKITVAILATEHFDASTVDANTVRFGAAAPLRSRLEDIDGDGDWDLSMTFNTQAVGIACGATEATLTGQALDGAQITATNPIKTVGCKNQ